MFNFNIQRFASDGAMYTSSGEWVAAYFTETVDFVYIPAGIEFEGSADRGYTTVQRVDAPVTYAIKGVSSATGDSSTVTVTLSGELSAVTVSDTGTVNVQYEATVSGGDMTTLSVIVGGTTYAVNSSGKLYIPINLPDFGLMTKADKLKLDGIDTTTLLTKTEASSTYVTKALAITSGEMTANGFVLKNALGNGVVTIPAQA